MAEVSRKSKTMNKILGVPEERDFERAITPATKTTFQTPKLKSVAQVEKESLTPVMTKTYDEDDLNKGYRIQPWDDYWADDRIWYSGERIGGTIF